jgi:catechol 2,3-dioxygenase-like lactoylglutathione lyase family enzyme
MALRWLDPWTQHLGMHVVRLDHVTINTADLEATLAFYELFLGLRPGPRPEFSVGGAWLYPEGGDYAILHVIAQDRPPENGTFDHFAFRCVGLDGYLSKVKASGEWYKANPIAGTSFVQIHHYDPNRVMIEATFEGEPLASSEEVR